MEDERGAGSHDEGGGSDPPLSSKLAGESSVDNMGSDNQVEEAFVDGDGEEIMVEVVGSDVYVDGISGNGEGDSEMGEAGNLEDSVADKNEESTDVFGDGDGKEMEKNEESTVVFGDGDGKAMEKNEESGEGDAKKMEEGGLGSSELRDEKHEKIDINLSESVVAEDEQVSTLPVGGVSGVDVEELNPVNEETAAPTEVAGATPMEICEEEKTQDETVVKDTSEVAVSEPSSNPVEATSEEKSDLAEEKEVLPSSDNSKDFGKSEETRVDNDDVAGEVHPVDASGGEEILDSVTQKDDNLKAEAECPSTVDKSVTEKDECPAESEKPVPKSNALVSEVPDESKSGSNEFHGAELEAEETHVSHAGADSAHENSIENQQGESGGNEDKCLNAEVKDDTEEIVQNKSSISPSEKEIVQSDSGIDSEIVGAEQVKVVEGSGIDSEIVGAEQVKVVEAGVPGEKVEEITDVIGNTFASQENAEIPTKDDSAENIHLREAGAEAVAEAETAMVTEECVPLQSTTQGVDSQATETSSHEAEDTNMVANEVTTVAADSIVAQVSSTDISLPDEGSIKESKEGDELPMESNGFHVPEAKPMDVDEERESGQAYHHEGTSSESEKPKISNEVMVNYAGFLKMKQSDYLMSPNDEGGFATSDLVWGKVRSHPWWPGQIVDPVDASEKAVKHHKKDSYLVAYFGDQTFAWNDSSALKPFRSYFSQIQKQSNSESFHNAVSCALEEIERRVRLGLSCPCTPKDEYAKVEAQDVENTGIREESNRRLGVDKSSSASCFQPNELLEFIRAVAPRASSGADGLDLMIVRAQLSAFSCFKGYRSLTEFPATGELLEVDEDFEQISDETVASHKHRPKEGAQSRKERSLMELMGDREYSPDAEDGYFSGDHGKSGKKRKTLDPLGEGSEKRVSFSTAKAPGPAGQAPKPSFKIGECIRRVASQLTKGDEMAVDGSQGTYEPSEKKSMVVSAESLSVNEILSQLEVVALEPKKRQNHLQNDIRAFFMGFRNSTAVTRRGRKKKSEQAVGGSGEEFEFDDVNDSYWTDRIVQNYSAEQLLHERMNGGGNLQLVAFGMDKPGKGRKSNSRKRYSTGSSPNTAPEFDENAKRIKQESSPAELILNFAERNCVPSEISLNKMFRRFGPLMESETEVDHEAGSAKVIFKRGSDAEVARNSAEKFAIFGPVLVNYQIGYSPVISVRISPVTLSLPHEEANMML